MTLNLEQALKKQAQFISQQMYSEQDIQTLMSVLTDSEKAIVSKEYYRLEYEKRPRQQILNAIAKTISILIDIDFKRDFYKKQATKQANKRQKELRHLLDHEKLLK